MLNICLEFGFKRYCWFVVCCNSNQDQVSYLIVKWSVSTFLLYVNQVSSVSWASLASDSVNLLEIVCCSVGEHFTGVIVIAGKLDTSWILINNRSFQGVIISNNDRSCILGPCQKNNQMIINLWPVGEITLWEWHTWSWIHQ